MANTVAAVLPKSKPFAADLDEPTQHSIPQTLALHLAPGVLAVAVFLLTAPLVEALGYPADFAKALFGMPIAVVAFQLGYLLIASYRECGCVSLAPAVGYRSPLSRREYALWIGALFAWTILVYVPVASLLGDSVKSLFGWLPAALTTEPEYTGYGTSVIATIFVVQLVVFSVAAFVEELYFRGHLLPRLSRFGLFAPLVSTALFALYHLDQIWSVPSVLIAFLPIAYVVYAKRNIWIAVALHVAVNAIWQVLLLMPLLAE